MGAEREDTDPNPKRVGTEPGLGKVSGSNAAAPAADVPDDGPPPVDFDALHAALGDPLDYEDLSPESEPLNEVDQLFAQEEDPDPEGAIATPPPAAPAGAKALRIGESSGQASATYASARPHTIPPSREPVEDLNAPPVIVDIDDHSTVPSAPPKMTVPIATVPHMAPFGPPQGPPGAQGVPMQGPPQSYPSHPAHPAQPPHPGSGPHPAAPPGAALSQTPMPFPAIQRSGPAHLTMRMPDRPLNPRRGKTPTVVVRARGPSAKQKLVAFMAMLLLVTACGIAVIIWRKPKLLGLDPAGSPSASVSAGASASSGMMAPSATSNTAAPSATMAAASASALAPKIKTVKTATPAPPPPTATAVPSVQPHASAASPATRF